MWDPAADPLLQGDPEANRKAALAIASALARPAKTVAYALGAAPENYAPPPLLERRHVWEADTDYRARRDAAMRDALSGFANPGGVGIAGALRFGGAMRRHAYGATEREAERIARELRRAGMEAGIDNSRISASRYVYAHPRGATPETEAYKIRVSDHADRHGGSDFDLYVPPSGRSDWSSAVAAALRNFGRDPAATLSSIEGRSATAARAAETRRADRTAAAQAAYEARLAAKSPQATVLNDDALRETAALWKGAPRKIVGPRGGVRYERVDPDLIALARQELARRLGPDAYMALRPPGMPRASWRESAGLPEPSGAP